jgi:hypothetical protein
MKECTTVTQVTKEHLVTGKKAEGVIYVGPNTVASWQLY